MSKKLGFDNFIQFNEAQHSYSDSLGNTGYISVSQILKHYYEEFDEQKMSYFVAKKRAGKGASDIEIRTLQQVVLDEWHAKRDNACDYGTDIHFKLEMYFKTGRIEDEFLPLVKQLTDYFGENGKMYQEARLYSLEHLIAGTTDVCIQRNKGGVVDVYDYKSNDIWFQSINKKDGSYLNKFMLDPVSHLEDCNYNKYSLQMSMYAYMIELTYGLKIGRLSILGITKDFKLEVFPCNYLKNEVNQIFKERLNQICSLIHVSSTELTNVEYDNDNW